MKIFVDNNISPRLVEAIRILAEVQQLHIEHLRDRFPQDAKDVDWIGALGREGGWVIVSGDTRISRSKAEQAAWHESGLTAFFVSPGFTNKGPWQQAEIAVRLWPEIIMEARRARPGSGFLCPLEGRKLRSIYDPP